MDDDDAGGLPELKALPGLQPQYPQSQYLTVTLEQLMAHSSGMPYNATSEPADGWFPNPESAGLNDSNLMARRIKFVHASVLDTPLFPAGTSKEYGGGTIICAAMVERRTGTRFERLLKQYVYDPLGMSDSGWGITSTGPLTGPWQHTWDPQLHNLQPNEVTHSAPYDFHSHGVAGAYATSAADMGKFIKENLRPDPQVISVAVRKDVQSRLPCLGSDTTCGAWACANTSAPATADLWHNGDTGSMYAYADLQRSAHWGSAAFSNVNNRLAGAAVADMQLTMRAMIANWKVLFENPAETFRECAHPSPALVSVPGGHWVFNRRRTGTMVGRMLPTGGAPLATIEFPGVYTSGVAAASSSDGQSICVMARGADGRIMSRSSTDAGTSWQLETPVLARTFLTGPAVAMSASGDIIHVVAIGTDSKMYRSRRVNGGKWSAWTAIGAGVFNTQPAVACSADGDAVHAFARGMDYQIWQNRSSDSATSWRPAWAPMASAVLTTGPAAACDQSGSTVHVLARTTDRSMLQLVMSQPPAWVKPGPPDPHQDAPTWKAIPDGRFMSSAAMTLSRTGSVADVVALGDDFCTWRSTATGGGRNWGGWSRVGSEAWM